MDLDPQPWEIIYNMSEMELEYDQMQTFTNQIRTSPRPKACID